MQNLPVDFVSSHPYPTSYPIDSDGNGLEISRPVTCTYTDIQWLKKTIAKSKYRNAEIHLTEWSSSPSPRDFTHDYLQAATYIVKVNLDCRNLVNSLSYWIFTDVCEERGAGDTIFHGGFGMINFQGLVKPAFHAYRMLNQLGDEELKNEDWVSVTRHTNTGKIAAIVYYYPAEVIAAVPASKVSRDIAEETIKTGAPKSFLLELTDLNPFALFEIEILDQGHGFVFRDWQKMGSPEPPTREQIKYLKTMAMNTKKEQVKSDSLGRLRWEIKLDPWAVVLLKEI